MPMLTLDASRDLKRGVGAHLLMSRRPSDVEAVLADACSTPSLRRGGAPPRVTPPPQPPPAASALPRTLPWQLLGGQTRVEPALAWLMRASAWPCCAAGACMDAADVAVGRPRTTCASPGCDGGPWGRASAWPEVRVGLRRMAEPACVSYLVAEAAADLQWEASRPEAPAVSGCVACPCTVD